MPSEAERLVKSVARSFSVADPVITNEPKEYADRQKQIFAERTRRFIADRAHLATDFFIAEVQGLKESFYDYTRTGIRLSNISTMNQTSLTAKKKDDYKEVLLTDRRCDYLPLGAKIKAAGSVWIAVNPSNISTVSATSIVARCNASYNSFDEYGNVITEPIIIEKTAMVGNDNATPKNLVLLDGYFNVTCQLNENTRKLGDSHRIILGSKAYFITGFTDFIQEFSGDTKSAHILTFTIRQEEPTDHDDMENLVANGKCMTFAADISGNNEMVIGERQTLEARFIVNGETLDASPSLPQTWEWSSDNPEVVSIDADSGIAEAHQTGYVEISARLKQNANIITKFRLQAVGESTDPRIAFADTVPTVLRQYRSVTLRVNANGSLEEEPVWNFSGAPQTAYGYEIMNGGHEAKISCFGASYIPLTVDVSYGGAKISAKIELEAF